VSRIWCCEEFESYASNVVGKGGFRAALVGGQYTSHLRRPHRQRLAARPPFPRISVGSAFYFVCYVAASPSGDGGGSARDVGHGISVFDLDLENLSDRRTEAKVRNVEGAAGSEGEPRGKEEGIVRRAVDQDLLLAVGQYANKTTRRGTISAFIISSPLVEYYTNNSLCVVNWVTVHFKLTLRLRNKSPQWIFTHFRLFESPNTDGCQAEGPVLVSREPVTLTCRRQQR
jgi:hypothetical protein